MTFPKLSLLFICALLSGAVYSESMPPGDSYEVGFSPKGGSQDLILRSISSANSSIQVAAYSFSSKPVATSLLEAHKRGVTVQVVADEKSNSQSYSATTFLANQGVPVRLNGKYSIMHHKFMVIDGLHVQTGSFNYSAAAASKNAENVLVIWSAKPLASRYALEWARLWDESTPLEKSY